MADINGKLHGLECTVKKFIALFNDNHDYSTMVYENWSAKDILGHIVFWHESFANDVIALTRNKKPPLLKGKLSDINKESVATTRSVSIPDLIKRLCHA